MAAQSFELDMEDPKQQSNTTSNGSAATNVTTTSSSPSSNSTNNEPNNVSESSKKNASSLDASLLSPTSANATVRTRRNNNTSTTSGKSSVFQLVKSKAATSSLATTVVSSSSSNIDTNIGSSSNNANSTTLGSNVFDENNVFEGDNHRDLEKTLPKIDLNRNSDLFGQSNNVASSGVINRKENVDDSPIAKPAMEGKAKFANTRIGRLIRRFINHMRVWSSSPIIKYSVITLLTLSLIALLVMFIVPMFSSSSSVNVPPIIRNEGDVKITPEVQKQEVPSSGPSLWERITSIFSRSDNALTSSQQTVTPPAELVLTLSHDKYRDNFESYLSQSKPIVLKKYSNEWIASSTWKKEITSSKEFIGKLNKMKKQLSKHIKRKGISITLVSMDKLPSSVYRVPFTPTLRDHEFEYDFPIALDQFSTLKTINSEIWFANPKKDQLIRIGRKENPNKFTLCMIAETSQLVQLSSPSGEDTESEIKTNDCIYIPSGWSFNFNIKAPTKFVTWVYE